MVKIKKIEYSKISIDEKKAWNYVLDHSDQATIFHTPEWIFLMVEKIGSTGEILIAYENEKPVGIFPYYLKKGKFFLKKSTTGTFETPYGGPILTSGTNENVIIQLLQSLERNINIVKSTIFSPPNSKILPFETQNFKSNKRESMLLNLEPSEDDLLSQLQKMKKRNIKKAEKNEVEIIDADASYIPEFHKMLADTYKRIGLNPPKGIDFYERIFELLKPLNRVKLLMAKLENEPIAATISLLYKDTVIFWQGASYREFMKFGPNDLLHWSIIKHAKQNGFKYYDLLQFHDRKGIELEPLKNFKQGFGANPEPYYSFTKEFNLNVKLKSLI